MRVRSFSNVPTQNQQQLNDSSHGPVSKNLLFKLVSDVSGGEQLRLDEYMKANRNAYGERMSEAQEQQLEKAISAK